MLGSGQIILLIYLAFFQSMTGRGFSTPFESATCSIYIVLLGAQLVYGYTAAKRMMVFQTVDFYLHKKD
jgi:hypothetical protein